VSIGCEIAQLPIEILDYYEGCSCSAAALCPSAAADQEEGIMVKTMTVTDSDSALSASHTTAVSDQQAFAEVVEMIKSARARAVSVVNTALIDLHWRIGEYISSPPN
jgi:hypothetical protein